MPSSELRITSGILKNQKYISPGTAATHPMSEKLRNALFNVLGDIEGLSVLDAFSGSGGIGLEAVSRGAKQVTFIESNLAAQKAAAVNIKSLNLENKVRLLRMNVETWIKTRPDKQFNIVIADPPYNNVQENLLIKLIESVIPGGVFVLSLPAVSQPLKATNLENLVSKIYGNSQLVFYRKFKT